MGLWVRLYMEAKEGEEQAWCAGFVCTDRCAGGTGAGHWDAVRAPGVGPDARRGGQSKGPPCIGKRAAGSPLEVTKKLKPGDIFVVRTSPVMWAHTGFVLAVNDVTSSTRSR